MKKIFLALSLLLISSCLFSQSQVAADSLLKYDGSVVTVCAKVTGTYVTSGKTKTTFINFGKSYPNHNFSVVIFESDLKSFKYKPAKRLLDKNICVTGKIKIYNGKPEMIVESPDQIKFK